MNQVSISKERLKSSELISHPKSAIQLRKVGDITFALCDSRTDELMLGFSSSALVRYLGSRERLQIINVRLVSQKVIIGLEPDDYLVLSMRLKDATLITLDEQDYIYESSPFISTHERGTLISPSKMWALPPEGCYARMLLTERMVHFLENLAEEGQHAHLVSMLWKEYELARDKSEPDRRLSIEGEFMSYSVMAFAHGLVLFDHV